jgi:hypothetical protein
VLELLPVADVENLRVAVVGAADGGFTLEVKCGSACMRFPESMTFEEALGVAIALKNSNGLRDEQVLVSVKDIWDSPDRSGGLDKLKNAIRNTPELLNYVKGGTDHRG